MHPHQRSPARAFAAKSALVFAAWVLSSALVPSWATTISAGYGHSCSVSDASKPTCWGAVPLEPANRADVLDVRAGNGFSCALRKDGAVNCWGPQNDSSQLGLNYDGKMPDRPMYSLERGGLGTGAPGATQIAAGARHACALTEDGNVYCWGDAGQGQLGKLVPALTRSEYAVKVKGLEGAVRIAAGNGSTCAVLRSGSVACVGAGSLLAGPQDDPGTPHTLAGIADAVDVSIFDGHGCIVRKAGEVACWGRNLFGELGVPAISGTQTTPVNVAGLPGPAKTVSAGYGFTCALMADGTIYCWGNHADYQLGVGYLANGVTTGFGKVVGITDATAISAGLKHVCAALDGGYVQCWGTGQALGHNLCYSHGAFYPNTGYQPAANPAFNISICAPARSATPFAVSALAPLSDAYMVLDWAERSLPATFPALNKVRVDETGRNYVGRFYSNGGFLGVNGHGTPHLMYLGPETNGRLVDLGTLAAWVREARK